jgi:hypothetical protein
VSSCIRFTVCYTSGYCRAVLQLLLLLLHAVLSESSKSSPAGLCHADSAAMLLRVILYWAWL